MLKQACVLCKVVGVIAIIGCLNWGLVGVANMNIVDSIFGENTALSRIVYGLVGLAGLALAASFFTTCPACKKK